MVIHIADELRVVLIAPVLGWMFPRHRTFDLHPVSQLIKYDAFQVGIVLHDQLDVPQGVFQGHRSRLIFKSGHPVPIICIGKIITGLGSAFAGGQELYFLQPRGKIPHRLIGFRVIHVRELMNPDDIKRVAQLQICRVLGMMAVHEFILNHFHSGHTGGFDQVPAIVVVRRLIHI